MDKKYLSERDICTKFITPAVEQAGWNRDLQFREEVGLTLGRIIVRGKLHSRGKTKRADYVLCYKPNIPVAGIEAKENIGRSLLYSSANCLYSPGVVPTTLLKTR
jgi:type I restriction enzyme R subunit